MSGILKTEAIQLGENTTATQNFTIRTNNDGTATLARGNVGATTQDILTIDANGLVTLTQGKQMALAGVQNASGTAVTFSAIPSWAKKVTPLFSGASGNGSSLAIIQLGTVSGFETSGYLANGEQNGAAISSGAGFVFGRADAAASNRGAYSLCLVDPATNTWAGHGYTNYNGSSGFALGGDKSLAGVLTQLRFTFVNGTDTWDAGKFNLLVEG